MNWKLKQSKKSSKYSMFNEKNLPKLILITPICFMALILVIATYIQIIDFNMLYEEETQQLQQIALNKDISNKKI